MKIIISKSAERALRRMDKPIRERIIAGIQKIPAGDIKKLKGYVSDYRLRIGDYRILYTMNEERIEVNGIAPRGGVYKRV